jgi:hypothetical protein
MWFPLEANAVAFRSLKQALFKEVAASAEPRRRNKTRSAQGRASQLSLPLRQNGHLQPMLAGLSPSLSMANSAQKFVIS